MATERTGYESLTTRLDVEVARRLRMLAAATRTTLQELVNQALTEYLDRVEAGSG